MSDPLLDRLRHVLRDDPRQPADLGPRAVQRGWITPQQLEACLREAEIDDRPLAAVLLAGGYLKTDQLAQLLRASGGTSGRHGLTGSEERDLPVEAHAAAADPANWIGPYLCVHLLGEGGMARVMKAWDRRLRRWVALKLMKPSMPEARRRFVGEARLAGRLDHPHIVHIYEAGEIGDVCFIAMEYIEGCPISEARLSPTRTLQILAEVAGAVAEAHRHGIVHRDIKPTNILVAKDGRGVIGDFGIARDLQRDTKLTSSGAIVGTPAYMAPEQARAELGEIDERTDVWGLGATAYELIVGEPPFAGLSMPEVIERAASGEVVAPRKRNPKVPREVELIVLKALRPEKPRRYPAAAAFKADLERYMRGDPIDARKSSITYRFYKKLRKRPAVFSLGAALAVTAVIATIVLLDQRFVHRRRLEAGTTASQASVAYLTGDFSRAETLARRATETAPENALGWYWLGRLKLRDYQRRRPLPGVWTAEGEVQIGPTPTESDEARRLKDEARELFTRMRTLGREGAQGEEEEAAEGILSLMNGHYSEAERRLARALQVQPSDAELRIALGLARYFQTNFAGAVDALEPLRRRRIPEEALFLAAYARAQTAAGMWEESHGADPTPRYGTAIEECDRFGAEPAAALVEVSLARYLMDRGREGVLEILERAGARVGGRSDVEGLMASADAQLLRGDWLAAHGQGREAEAAFESAVAEYARAAVADPRFAGAPIGRARTRDRLAQLLSERGRRREAREQWDRALSDLDAVDGSYIEVTLRRAWIEARQGPEGLPAAAARLLKAASENPERAEVHILAARVFNAIGFERQDDGALEQAEASAREARRINPRSAWAWNASGDTHVYQGVLRQRRGEDPSESYLAAVEDYTEALRCNPQYSGALMDRATAWDNLGLYRHEHGDDPTEFYGRAIEDYTDALGINPELAEAWVKRGRVRTNLGIYARDGAEFFRAAIEEDFAAALRIDPESVEALTSRGATLLEANRPLEAIEDFERVAVINPSLADSLRPLMERARRAAADTEF